MLRFEVTWVPDPCHSCHGRGVCPACDGRGVVGMGLLDAQECEHCAGSGRCPDCGGQGAALASEDHFPYTD